MATMMANKPAPPHQKLKRPSLPAVQTSMNGALSSRSSPSPLLTSTRPPDGSMQPPSAMGFNGTNTGTSGTGPRASNRRRDSQKPGDIAGRASRNSRVGLTDGQRSAKRVPEPYVKKDSDVLKKFRGKSPSLVVHLHPTNFRLEKSGGMLDGSFAYNGPLKVLLHHIKRQTVPHELMEMFLGWGVKFYDGCLIVEVHDHKSAKPESKSRSGDYNVASVHNVNQHITLTPYATDEQRRIHEEQQKAASKGPSDSSSQADVNAQPARKDPNKAFQLFNCVLYPTAQSLNEELVFFSSLPDPRSNARKQSATTRTPSSATTPHPHTPLSAIPSTPVTGQAAKKQKLWLKEEDAYGFEAALIYTQAPPLFLDPVETLEEAQKAIDSLTDDRHRKELPAPKTRKRTAAELADDEAAAAGEETFMLAMDENNRASSIIRGTGQAGKSDNDLGSSSFEPRFETWKAIEQIRVEYEERRRELKNQRDQQQREREAQIARIERDRQAREQAAEKQAEAQRAQQAQQAAEEQRRLIAFQQHEKKRRQEEQANAQRIANTHSAVPNGTAPVHQPSTMPVSQANHSSPIIRNGTPHSHSSPALGHGVPPAVPMKMTSSGQDMTNSPSRPSPAPSHGHPMVRPGSQQGPSRLGTPQMQRGTPAMPQATPVMSNPALASGRLSHATPPNVTSNPMVNGNPGPAAQQIGNSINTAQRQMMVEQQQQQQQKYNVMMQQAKQMQAAGRPIPQQMQDTIHAYQQQRHHQIQYQQQQAQQGNYQRQLAEQHQQGLLSAAGSPHLNRSPHLGQGVPTSMSPQQQLQAQQQQQMHQQNSQVAAHQRQHRALQQTAQQFYNRDVSQREQQLGRPLGQDELNHIKSNAVASAQRRQAHNAALLQQQQRAQQQAAAHQQQIQQQQHAHQQQQQQQQHHQGAQHPTQQQQMMMAMHNVQQQRNQQQHMAEMQAQLAAMQQAGINGQQPGGMHMRRQ